MSSNKTFDVRSEVAALCGKLGVDLADVTAITVEKKTVRVRRTDADIDKVQILKVIT